MEWGEKMDIEKDRRIEKDIEVRMRLSLLEEEKNKRDILIDEIGEFGFATRIKLGEGLINGERLDVNRLNFKRLEKGGTSRKNNRITAEVDYIEL